MRDAARMRVIVNLVALCSMDYTLYGCSMTNGAYSKVGLTKSLVLYFLHIALYANYAMNGNYYA